MEWELTYADRGSSRRNYFPRIEPAIYSEEGSQMTNPQTHEIEKKLYALDFAALDLHLYLNTHPHDRDALAEYNKILEEAKAVRAEYEKHIGPLLSFRCQTDDQTWSWLSEYSPWESEFNWTLRPLTKGDER